MKKPPTPTNNVSKIAFNNEDYAQLREQIRNNTLNIRATKHRQTNAKDGSIRGLNKAGDAAEEQKKDKLPNLYLSDIQKALTKEALIPFQESLKKLKNK